MRKPDIITKLRAAGLLERVLADLLGLDETPPAGKAIRCIHPDRHKNGDANPSLVIAKDGAGAQCQACGFGGGLLDIAMERWSLPSHAAAAAEIENRYLPEPPKSGKRVVHKPHTDAYEYVDEDEQLLFEVLRFNTTEPDGQAGKTFRQRRPDSTKSSGWDWSLGNTRRVLFRLPALRKAIESRQTIFIVEGEKDALALEAAGVVATCNPCGAGQWRPAYTEMLRGAARVVIVADKDTPGRAHARRIADALSPVVDEILVVEAKNGKDAAEHLAAGRGVDEFVDLEVETPEDTEPETSLIEIEVTPDVAKVVNGGLEALRRSSIEIYQRFGALVRIEREPAKGIEFLARPPEPPRIGIVSADSMIEYLSEAAYWYVELKDGPKRVRPPKWVVNVLLARYQWPFKWLEGVIETPTIRSDGSILDEPGYDPLTGLLYEPRREYPSVPHAPSVEDIAAALGAIREPFAEFPWQTPADEAAAIAALFTLVARHIIVGPAPLFGMVAPTPGSGKGLLVQALTILGTGQLPHLMSAQCDGEELGKTFTAIASEGHRAVLFDNAEGHFGSPVLAGALTTTTWTGRILGKTQTLTAPLNPVWFVTGNNISFVGDTGRRVVPVRVDPRCEHPEDRKFHHTDLLAFIRDNQPRLLTSALTLMRAFILAGRPHHGRPRLGSFEAWDDIVRSAVIWLMDADPCETRSELREHVDSDRETLRTVLRGWHETYPSGKAVSAAEAIRGVRSYATNPLHEAFTLLTDDGKLPTASALGYQLRRWKDRICDGLRLEWVNRTKRGVLWRVIPVDGDREGRGDDGVDGDDVSAKPKTGTEEGDKSNADAAFSSARNDRHHQHHRHPLVGESAEVESW